MTLRPLRSIVIAFGLAAVVFAACGSGAGVRHANAEAAPSRPWRAIVNVSVATLWTHRDRLRRLDAPSAQNPVDIPAWLHGMSTADREWLVGRVQTQALYGMTVYVLRQRGGWSYVGVRGQSSQLNPIGYPGWLPTRQLTGNLSLLAVERRDPVAFVTATTAWLRDPVSLAPRIQVSFATRLWITGVSGGYDLVATPGGGSLAIPASAVARYRAVSDIPRPTGARIVATARRFVGLAYLWGGTSAYGFDCSGFTYTIYRRFGIPLPRDADRQALHGAPVARADLRPGDLVFFAGPGGTGTIHHVAIFMGAGEVIEAPRTGEAVKIVPLAALMGEYAGARRYL